MKARFTLTIEYDADIFDDPECYEGATTPEERMEKEKEYLAEGGDYLFQALSCYPNTVSVKITPLS